MDGKESIDPYAEGQAFVFDEDYGIRYAHDGYSRLHHQDFRAFVFDEDYGIRYGICEAVCPFCTAFG